MAQYFCAPAVSYRVLALNIKRSDAMISSVTPLCLISQQVLMQLQTLRRDDLLCDRSLSSLEPVFQRLQTLRRDDLLCDSLSFIKLTMSLQDIPCEKLLSL